MRLKQLVTIRLHMRFNSLFPIKKKSSNIKKVLKNLQIFSATTRLFVLIFTLHFVDSHH